VGCLLVAALLVRVDGITRPSLETRELHNALLARQYYLGEGSTLPAWKQRVLQELPQSVKPVEPPVLDFLAASAFRLRGGEHLWIPRLVSALFWILGGVFLYLLGRRVTSPEGALVGLSLYLFWPYGVLISRLYMPDATMVALLLGAALTVVRYWEGPSHSRLAVAGIVSSLASAIKPGVALVFLLALFATLAASQRVFIATIVRGRLLVFLALASTASAIYFVYGAYVRDFLTGAAEGRIQPDLLATAWFWRGWWEMVSIVLPFPQRQALLALVPIVAGLAGIAVVRRGAPRAILVGLWLGYVAYALVFTVHAASHAYYALPLIPILALSIGGLAGSLLERLEASAPIARPALLVLVVLVLGVAAFKSHPGPADHGAIDDYRRIGELTGHTTHALVVDERLKSPIMYWGWLVGDYWYPPTRAQDLPTLGDPYPHWVEPAESTFLIVIDMAELQTERRLRTFTRNLRVVARTSRYAVFDLRGGRALTAARDAPGAANTRWASTRRLR
jgi:4-amino-4-deoxy-L-arabinose transferase-like glycosyltransferase